MKKILVLSCIAILAFTKANAQFEENFERGVPGKLTQKFLSQETTWIDFGISAINVQKPLSGENSAVFFNGLATKETITSLETPVLNLSLPDLVLEFKYLQREKNPDVHNNLAVELSNDNGVTWVKVASYGTTAAEGITPVISLDKFRPGTASIIRFVSTQPKVDAAYPIVIDDIKIYTAKKPGFGKANVVINDINVYPNPTKGIFTISSLSNNFEVNAFDINGRKVYSATYDTNEARIDFSAFPKGIYLLKVSSQDFEKTKKITIN
ncbi:T9SS type A sorting domain-containing protein [Flavobacterium sp.]|uniref:T9SS type A sorting domain-containing protein n=1 Tax=Flavobacterium sp. TaxID=239 RepID=UPI003D6BCFB4